MNSLRRLLSHPETPMRLERHQQKTRRDNLVWFCSFLAIVFGFVLFFSAPALIASFSEDGECQQADPNP